MVARPVIAAAREIAAGAPLIVDVEFGPGPGLYALSQGVWTPPGEGARRPIPNTGSLVRVGRHGTFDRVAGPLDQPTSVAFSGTPRTWSPSPARSSGSTASHPGDTTGGIDVGHPEIQTLAGQGCPGEGSGSHP